MTIAKKVSESISTLIEGYNAPINEQTDLATITKTHALNANPLDFAKAKSKTFKDDVYITPNTKLKGDLKKIADLKIGDVVQVIYQNTSRGHEATELKLHKRN